MITMIIAGMGWGFFVGSVTSSYVVGIPLVLLGVVVLVTLQAYGL